MHNDTPQPGPVSDVSRIAQDLQIRKGQVESVVQLLDEGNTVPFITRYRKERTGGLNEEVIRRIQRRIEQIRELAARKETILKSIDNLGKLSDELRAAILAADTSKRLEDLYLPYKPKKRSLANEAREKGLEPLALAIWAGDPAVANLSEILPGMINPEKKLASEEDILTGVGYILAERIAEMAEIRSGVRHVLWDSGKLISAKAEGVTEEQGREYRDYFAFSEPIRHIPPHRILAVNRGDREKILKFHLDYDHARVGEATLAHVPLNDHPHVALMEKATEDALNRLLLPSLENEVWRDLKEHAQDHAVHIFAMNLRSLLMQPPLWGKMVLAVDPGLRTGCKIAVLDGTGKLIEEGVIYPHPPQNKVYEAKGKLEQLICKHQINLIAIGNGTACRETEQVISDLIAELEGRAPRHPATPSSSETHSC